MFDESIGTDVWSLLAAFLGTGGLSALAWVFLWMSQRTSWTHWRAGWIIGGLVLWLPFMGVLLAGRIFLSGARVIANCASLFLAVRLLRHPPGQPGGVDRLASFGFLGVVLLEIALPFVLATLLRVSNNYPLDFIMPADEGAITVEAGDVRCDIPVRQIHQRDAVYLRLVYDQAMGPHERAIRMEGSFSWRFLTPDELDRVPPDQSPITHWMPHSFRCRPGRHGDVSVCTTAIWERGPISPNVRADDIAVSITQLERRPTRCEITIVPYVLQWYLRDLVYTGPGAEQ